MDLNPTNAFGEVLLDLIEAQYGGDFDAGVQALMEATGLSEEEVVAIIQGEVIVEDEALLSDIVDAFPDADDEDLTVIVEVASGVEADDREALVQEIEMDMEASEVPAEEAPVEEAAYGYSRPTANFSRQQSTMVDNRVAQLENKLANFEAQEYLTDALKEVDASARSLVESAVLPPAMKTLLIGNFSNDKQRLARFSQMAQENGVDIGTMLFATQYAMGLIENSGNYVEFKDYSLSEEEANLAKFSASEGAIAEQDIYAIFGEEGLNVH